MLRIQALFASVATVRTPFACYLFGAILTILSAGTTDSFAGVDTGDLTSGVFNSASLLDPTKGACFLYQASLAAMPSAAAPALGELGSVFGWALNQLGPNMKALGCPELATFDNSLFNSFPGSKYQTGTSSLKK